MNKTLVIDNGSQSIKAGYSDDSNCRIIPNFVMKTKKTNMVFVADLINGVTDVSGLYYRSPFERGYLVNWDVQLAVWDRLFDSSVTGCEPTSTNLLLTEPVLNIPQIQKNYDEIIFEEYGFESLLRATGPDIIANSRLVKMDSDHGYSGYDALGCVLIVDIGFTFTHIVPFYKGKCIKDGIRRIDIGGLHLTNYLKEVISFRHFDMMDEGIVINEIKEDCCFVSTDYEADMIKTKFSTELDLKYVLPDFTAIKKGFIYDPSNNTQNIDQEQILSLKSERFVIPECLFHPSDICLEQGGIHEAIVESILACPKDYKNELAQNIILVGGSSKLKGLKERLRRELRPILPTELSINITVPDNDPQTYAWECGRELARETSRQGGPFSTSTESGIRFLKKGEYLEIGPDRAISFFDSQF